VRNFNENNSFYSFLILVRLIHTIPRNYAKLSSSNLTVLASRW
jgi:hypothetical protein